MKNKTKLILRIFLGVLAIIISNILLIILFKDVIAVHNVMDLKWLYLLSSSIGFYIAGLINRKTKLILTPILFISLGIYIPFQQLYFPFILLIILFSSISIVLSRKEIGKRVKIPSTLILIGILSFFLFSKPLIIENKDFGTDSAKNLYNATVLWDFTPEKPSSLPNETFHDKEGNEINLKNFEGKTLFVTFWATWCGPCLGEKPELEKLKRKFQDNPDIAFIDISIDSNIEKWKSYLSQHEPTGIQLVSQNDAKTHSNFEFSATPFHLIADSENNYKKCSGPFFIDEKLLSNPVKLNEYLNTPYKVFKITTTNGKSNTIRVR